MSSAETKSATPTATGDNAMGGLSVRLVFHTADEDIKVASIAVDKTASVSMAQIEAMNKDLASAVEFRGVSLRDQKRSFFELLEIGQTWDFPTTRPDELPVDLHINSALISTYQYLPFGTRPMHINTLKPGLRLNPWLPFGQHLVVGEGSKMYLSTRMRSEYGHVPIWPPGVAVDAKSRTETVVNTWQHSINGELTVGQIVYWVSRFYRIPPGLLTLRRSDRPGEEDARSEDWAPLSKAHYFQLAVSRDAIEERLSQVSVLECALAAVPALLSLVASYSGPTYSPDEFQQFWENPEQWWRRVAEFSWKPGTTRS